MTVEIIDAVRQSETATIGKGGAQPPGVLFLDATTASNEEQYFVANSAEEIASRCDELLVGRFGPCFSGGFWGLCGFLGLNVYAEWVTSADFFELFFGPLMFWLASLSIIVGLSAIVFGFAALVAITRSGESLTGRRDAIFGLCVGTVPVAFLLVVAFWAGSYRI